MKIAIVTNDGKTISGHFGRAQFFLIVEIKNEQELSRKLVKKIGHQHFQDGGPEHAHLLAPHGFDSASRNRHSQMLKAIGDCQVVIAGGMGQGAIAGIKESGKKNYLVENRNIEDVIALYNAGNLENSPGLAH